MCENCNYGLWTAQMNFNQDVANFTTVAAKEIRKLKIVTGVLLVAGGLYLLRSSLKNKKVREEENNDDQADNTGESVE